MMGWITGFFMAWGMFFIVPCPVLLWDEQHREKMLLEIPLIGFLIGGLWMLFAWILRLVHAPAMLFAALVCLFPHFLSGGIHLDGYMDCCDAILSRRDLETRRKILKDSHVGSFAVMAIAFLFLVSFAAAASWKLQEASLKAFLPLLVTPAITRSCSSCALFFLKPMNTSSYKEMKRGYKYAALAIALLLAFCPLGLAVLWGCPQKGIFAPIAMAASALAIRLASKDLEGMSGDISGFAITIGELAAITAMGFFN